MKSWSGYETIRRPDFSIRLNVRVRVRLPILMSLHKEVASKRLLLRDSYGTLLITSKAVN